MSDLYYVFDIGEHFGFCDYTFDELPEILSKEKAISNFHTKLKSFLVL